MLVKYIRNNKNQPVGCVLALKTDNNIVSIGWSLCRKNTLFNKGDIFDKVTARNLAHARALKRLNRTEAPIIPHSVLKELITFIPRAKKYFKTDRVHAGSKYAN